MRGRVLITDGDQRAALACVRALGRRGYRCFVEGPGSGSVAGASRYCEGKASCPDPLDDQAAFLEHIHGRIRVVQPEFLLPITEKSLRALLPIREQLGDVVVPFPSLEVFLNVSDKRTVLRSARDLGICIPRQRIWPSPSEAASDRVPEAEFPLVIKPSQSVSLSRGPAAPRKVEYISDSEELNKWIANSDPGLYPVLVQERVRGSGIGVFVLFWGGVLRAVVGHRRIREKPPSGGVSVLRESTVPDKDVLEPSLNLLQTLGWTDGVAMVEFKRDESTGRPYLMEVNGRFWGSLQLAIDAGVDFPTLLLESAVGNPPRETVRGRPGVRTRWLLGDVDQLASRLRGHRQGQHMAVGSPGKARAIFDFLADFRPGIRLEVFRWADPGPFLCELVAWLRHLYLRRFRG